MLLKQRGQGSNIKLVESSKLWHTGIPWLWTQVLDAGLWTLDFGRWTLDAGFWTLDAGRWTLDAILCTLGFGHWTLSLTVLEQNQKPVSDYA